MKTHSRLLLFLITFLIGGLVLLNLPVSAARLSSMSDTLSSHAVNGLSNHTITYRSASGVAASATIRLFLADAAADLGSVTSDDIDLLIGGSSVPLAAAATANTWGVGTTPATRLITLTAPSSSNLVTAGQTVIIRIGTNAVTDGTGARQIRNSASSGSKYISILSGNDVGLFSVRVGIEDSTGGTITPTIDVSGTAPAPPTTAAVPVAVPAPAPTTTTTEPAPTSQTTATPSQPAETPPATQQTPEPSPAQTTTTPTPTPAAAVKKEEPSPAPQPPTPAPEKQKTITTTQTKESTAQLKKESAPAPAEQPEPKPVIPVEEVFIPPTAIEQSPTEKTTTENALLQPSAPSVFIDGGVIISAPKIELPSILPSNAVVQNLASPVFQQFSFAPAPADGAEQTAAPLSITYATGGGGLVEAEFTQNTISNSAHGIEAKISAQPTAIAQFLLGIQIPGPQLADKLVLGNKTFFITAERLNTETAGDVAVTKLSEPIDVKFCYTEQEIEGVNEHTIRMYSFDSIDGIRAESTEWNSATRCAASKIDHLSVFAALADLVPGGAPNQIYVLPTEKVTKIDSDVKTENLGMEDVKTGAVIEFFEKKIYTTPNEEIALCIPASTFKKPVKKMFLFIENQKYPLSYNSGRDCYALTIKAPSERGKQKVLLKIVYNDDQVQVVELETVVTGALQAKLLPRVQKAAKQVQETAIAVNETVKQTVETTQPVLQSTAVSTAPIVTVANPAVSANIINWYHYLNHLISSLLSLLGLRKKRKPWGAVYNAISKMPIDLAIVRLFVKQSNKLIDTQVTDKNGRFSFIVPGSEYYIEARKPPFLFPSKIVSGTIDGDFTNIYRQESFTISKPDEVLTLSIPLDPPNPKEKQGQKISVGGIVKQLITKYSKAALFISLTISALLAFYTPNPVNATLLALNCVYTIFQVLIMYKVEKPWGTVFDMITLEPVPLAAISIFDAVGKKLLRTRLTDYIGRFNFLAPTGEYLITAAKEKYTFPPTTRAVAKKFTHIYIGGNIKVKKDKALVKMDIPMQPASAVSSLPSPAPASQSAPATPSAPVAQPQAKHVKN